jgi:ATP-dependent Clp protease ATP-binding subunit ClpC
MTSNIGSRQLKDFGQGVGFSTTARQQGRTDHERSIIENALKKTFAPEFLNRIDDVVIFNSLEQEHIHKIIDIELSGLYERVKELGYSLKLSDAAKNFIVEKGWDQQFGARPLKRAIQKYVEDKLAEEIIQTKLEENDMIIMDKKEDEHELTIKIEKQKKQLEANN